MTNLQLRDVPEDLAARARSRASKLEMSLSTYLRTLLEADIAAHAWDDWAQAHRPPVDGEATNHSDQGRSRGPDAREIDAREIDAREIDAREIDAVGEIRAGRAERADSIEHVVES